MKVDDAHPAAHRRLDESMTLLRETMERPLDPGYAAAAARKRLGQEPPRTRWRGVSLMSIAIILGFGAATAVVALTARNQTIKDAHTTLVNEIRERTAANARTETDIASVQADIHDLQEVALGSDSALLTSLTDLGMAAGTVPVTGPGMTIILTDAQPAPGKTNDVNDRVLDVDLQVVANGLWAAGAEAIAINGHRLTSMSAIRGAGEAILVDLQPLVPPYVVEAIGNSSALQANFARGAGGRRLQMLKDTFGISVDITGVSRLNLPGSDTVTLRYANPASPASTSSPSPSPSSAQEVTP